MTDEQPKPTAEPGEPTPSEPPHEAGALDEPPAAEGEPTPSDSHRETVASGGPPPVVEPTPGRAWVRLILPVVLTGGALAMHWRLNVPEVKPVPVPGDQGVPRPKGARKPAPFRPRTDAQLERMWKRYTKMPITSEPVNAPWAKTQQALVNKAMVVARRHVFERSPESPQVVLSATECHTVRCRFTLRSPVVQELDMLVAALRSIESGGETLWRQFDVERIEPVAREGRQPESQMQITVAFVADNIEPDSLEVIEPAGTGDPPTAPDVASGP